MIFCFKIKLFFRLNKIWKNYNIRCSLSWSSHWREEHISNCWDSWLENEINSVIECLWADDSSFLGEESHATKLSWGFIIFDALEEFGVHNDFAWNWWWVFTFKSLNLCHDELSVLVNSILLNWFNNGDIFLSASDKHLLLHKFDQSLIKKTKKMNK